jgi:hypothetical protein
MNTVNRSELDGTPDWLVGEMPPGYETRLIEIQRLSADLAEMERFGRLLWQVGHDLAQSIGDAFVALGFGAEETADSGDSLIVRLGDRRRLLLHVSTITAPIQKRSPDLTRMFQLLNETAEPTDRVVLVTNASPQLKPAERPTPVGPEALDLLQRLGANVLTGPAVFTLWRLSLDDKERARKIVERLHEQDGGLFQVPALFTR